MAIAFVQSAQNTVDPSGTTVARAYTGAVTAGSLLIADVTWWSATGPSGVADSVNGAWTAIGTPITTGSAQRSQLFYRANTGAGTPTVTATWGAAADFPAISVYEFSGAATTSPVDVSATAGPTTSTSAALSLTPTADGALVFITINTVDLDRTFTPTGGLTAGQESMLAGNGWGFADFWTVQTTAGVITPTVTISSSTSWKVIGSAFKAATGGGAVAAKSINTQRPAVIRAANW